MPSHGDFLRRRVSDAFVAVWDAWLQECIAASRIALHDQWLDVYLTSPAWRFACAPGVFGAHAVIGLMVPSVDRVGRYFYLALVAELPEEADVVEAATSFESFFDAAQRLVIETLEAEQVDFDAFDQGVMQLGADLHQVWHAARRVTLDGEADEILNAGCGPWQIPVGSSPQIGPMLQQLTARRLANLYELLGEAGRQWFRHTPLFAPHERIAAAARALGVQTVVLTGPGDEGLVAGLAAFFAKV
jgi:type VI secretion system protein ImpM